MEVRDIVWLAGWLEGEGCFGHYWLKRNRNGTGLYSPQIRVGTSDLDVSQRAAKIVGGQVYKVNMAAHLRRCEKNPLGPQTRRQMYDLRLSGAKAAGWMMTLYPLMGERRKQKIREVLAKWRATPSNGGSVQTIWAANAARKART